MHVAVDGSAEMRAYELCCLEVELEPADQIDVEGVGSREQWLQSKPATGRHTSRQPLTATFGAHILERHAIVGLRDFDQRSIAGDPIETAEKMSRSRSEIVSDLHDRNEFPIERKRGFERAECVRDAAPFLDRRVERVTTVDDVPDKRADHTQPVSGSRISLYMTRRPLVFQDQLGLRRC